MTILNKSLSFFGKMLSVFTNLSNPFCIIFWALVLLFLILIIFNKVGKV